MRQVTSNSVLAFLCLVVLRQVATEDQCSDDRLQKSNGRVWLETERPLYVGQATRVAAIVCTAEYPIILQIWEIASSVRDPVPMYKLIWSKTLYPARAHEMEIFQLHSTDYVELSLSHRIGLRTAAEFSHQPISVLRKFDWTLIQLVSSNEAGPFETNGIYQFSDIEFPGMFYIEFCGPEPSPCPMLHFPTLAPTTTTLAPSRCAPDQRSSEGKVHLERSRILSHGIARAVKVTFCENNPVKIQIWRPNDVNSDGYQFMLVWEKVIRFRPADENGTNGMVEDFVISLSETEFIYIQDSYRLGIQTVDPEDAIPIPKKFSEVGGNLVTSGERGEISLCESLAFDEIAFPEEFYVEFCNNPDCARGMSDSEVSMNENLCSTTSMPTILDETDFRVNIGPQISRSSYLWTGSVQKLSVLLLPVTWMLL